MAAAKVIKLRDLHRSVTTRERCSLASSQIPWTYEASLLHQIDYRESTWTSKEFNLRSNKKGAQSLQVNTTMAISTHGRKFRTRWISLLFNTNSMAQQKWLVKTLTRSQSPVFNHRCCLQAFKVFPLTIESNSKCFKKDRTKMLLPVRDRKNPIQLLASSEWKSYKCNKLVFSRNKWTEAASARTAKPCTIGLNRPSPRVKPIRTEAWIASWQACLDNMLETAQLCRKDIRMIWQRQVKASALIVNTAWVPSTATLITSFMLAMSVWWVQQSLVCSCNPSMRTSLS